MEIWQAVVLGFVLFFAKSIFRHFLAGLIPGYDKIAQRKAAARRQ